MNERSLFTRVCITVVVVGILGLAFLWGGPDVYFKCTMCNAAFKSPAWHHGLPGQMVTDKCRYCNGRLRKCSKELSGWVDGAPDDGQ